MFQCFKDCGISLDSESQRPPETFQFLSEDLAGQPLFSTALVTWQRISYGRGGYGLVPHSTVLVSFSAHFDLHAALLRLCPGPANLHLLVSAALGLATPQVVVERDKNSYLELCPPGHEAWLPCFSDWRSLRYFSSKAVMRLLAALILDRPLALLSRHQAHLAKLLCICQFLL